MSCRGSEVSGLLGARLPILLPLQWALGGSQGRSRVFGEHPDVSTGRYAHSRFRRRFHGFTATQFSKSASDWGRPSQG